MNILPLVFGIGAVLGLCCTVVAQAVSENGIILHGTWVFTLICFLAWVVLNRESVIAFFTSKKTRAGASVGFVVFLVLGILVFVNILAKEYPWRKDITRGGLNSLSPQTVKILKELPQDVKIYYFHTLNEKDKGEALLKNYQHQSAKVKYEFVDSARRPTLTESMEVKRNDTAVLVLEGTPKKMKVEGATEEKITNGLIKLLRTREQTVYFTVGHGERSTESESDPSSYGTIKAEVEKQGYAVKQLNLLTAPEGKVPADAAVIVVGGPRSGFYPKELEILGAWLKSGGRLLAAVDLDPAASGLAKGSAQLVALLKDYGVSVPAYMLVDPLSRAANVEPQVLLGFAAAGDHPVTKGFAQSTVAANFLFPLTSHIMVAESDTVAAKVLAKTSPNAWAESDWGSLKTGVVRFDEGKDKKGEMALGYAVETRSAPTGEAGDQTAKKPGTRIAIFATANFAANNLVDKVSNRDLFLNSVAWLANDENLISIRPKETEDGLKSFSNSVLNLILLFTVFVFPLLILIAGGVVWWRRSKQ